MRKEQPKSHDSRVNYRMGDGISERRRNTGYSPQNIGLKKKKKG